MANETLAQTEATIAGIVAQSGGEFDDNSQDFDILLRALQTADLVGALDDPNADFTVFAPTDAAFVALAQDFGYEGTNEAEAFDAIVNELTVLGDGDPLPLLQNILFYHVAPGARDQTQLQAEGQINTLLEGASVTVQGNQLADNEPDLLDPNFIGGLADVQASNGTIQGIDRVLIPLDIPGNTPLEPTIADIVAQSGGEFDNNDQDFDILLRALQTADLVGALDDPNADFTVFAPTDAAFVTLAQDFGYRGIDEGEAFDVIVDQLTVLGDGDPAPVLTDILLYHVSPDARDQAQLQAEGQVNTLLEGASFNVQGNQLVDNEPDLLDPNFVDRLANVDAANGTIQGIDRVLIPLDIPGNDSNLITGGEGNNFLFGLIRPVTIQAGDGHDSLLGSFDDDLLDGEEGDDFLLGNGGDDIVRGGSGNDLMFGGAGSDLLLGGAGDDAIFSGSGDDLIDGGAGDDFISLNGGADSVVLSQGNGTDIIEGFHIGETTFTLGSGLTFSDLSFLQGNLFSSILAGEEILAEVTGVSAEALNSETNFV